MLSSLRSLEIEHFTIKKKKTHPRKKKMNLNLNQLTLFSRGEGNFSYLEISQKNWNGERNRPVTKRADKNKF